MMNFLCVELFSCNPINSTLDFQWKHTSCTLFLALLKTTYQLLADTFGALFDNETITAWLYL